MHSLYSWYVQVFFQKLRFNLSAEARKTYLNYFWWVIEPSLYVAVFFVVFDIFLNRGTPNFLVFLLCGKIPFLWLSKSVVNSTNCLAANQGLIHQIKIPKLFFPLLVVFQDSIKQVLVFFFLIVFFVVYGVEASWNWFYLIPIVLVQLTLIIAMSVVVAAITPFIPDFKNIISVLMMLLMFSSGIFYSYQEVILPLHQDIFLLNPMANLVVNYRLVLMEQSQPLWGDLFAILGFSMIIIVAMMYVYKRADNLLTRLVIQ